MGPVIRHQLSLMRKNLTVIRKISRWFFIFKIKKNRWRRIQAGLKRWSLMKMRKEINRLVRGRTRKITLFLHRMMILGIVQALVRVWVMIRLQIRWHWRIMIIMRMRLVKRKNDEFRTVQFVMTLVCIFLLWFFYYLKKTK